MGDGAEDRINAMINGKPKRPQHSEEGFTWGTGGKEVNIKDMTDRHIQNCVKKLDNGADTSENHQHIIKIFNKELERRRLWEFVQC